MAERPNQPANDASGGWIQPENPAQSFSSPTPSKQVPIPADEAGKSQGSWYVPAEDKTRVQALDEPLVPQASQPPLAVQPTSATSPTSNTEKADLTPSPTPSPSKATSLANSLDLPAGAALSTEVDYSNYVPGKGFVPRSETAPASATASTPPPQTAQTPPPGTGVVTPASGHTSTSYAIPPQTGISPAASQPVAAVQPTPTQPVVQPVLQPAAPITPVYREPSAPVVAAPPASTTATPPMPPPTAAFREPSMGLSDTGSSVAMDGPAGTGVSNVTPAQPPAQQNTAALTQKFVSVERQVQVLRRRYTAGAMTRDALQTELRKLMILDDGGNWWMIGLESDRWYRYNGRDWNPALPPGYSAPAPALSAANVTAPTVIAIPLDEYGMPLPARVPVNDDGATIVSRSAPKLDTNLRSDDTSAFNRRLQGGQVAYNSGATVASNAIQSGVTVPSAAVSAGGVGIPAPGGDYGAPARPLQPDYGPRPTGWGTDRQRAAGCLVQAAVVGVVVFLIAALVGSIGSVLYYTSTINRYSDRINQLSLGVDAELQSVRIVDSAGNLIYQLNDPNTGARLRVPLAEISPYLIAATVATENERFYDDPGFDVVAMTRAVLQNLRAGSAVSGASTITQQLTRAKVLEAGAAADRSSTRKITEILVASEVARRYTKSQILEYYLNTVYYGNLAYGIEAAANAYFGKKAKELTIVEAAFLAGVVQSPAGYDPANDAGESSYDRVQTVLRLMVANGCIQMEHSPNNTAPFCVTANDVNTGEVAVQLAELRQLLIAFKPRNTDFKYPHFVNYIRTLLEAEYGQEALYNGGFTVTTTVDPRIQEAAEQIAKARVAQLANQRVTNAAVVVMRPSDGAILAMVGSVDFNNKEIDGQVNVAISPRQPGSSIKPFVYTVAMEQSTDGSSWYPGTVVWDIPTDFNGYRPENYTRRFLGPMSVRSALAQSQNIPAVKALEYVGIERFKQFAERIGLRFPLTQPDQAGLPLALGGVEVSLLDMVRGYSLYANGGTQVPSYAISRITRRNGATDEVVFQYKPPEARKVVEPGIAYLITSILSDNAARSPAFGANSSLFIPGYNAAAKTGTTNDFKDNWTVGYTPQFVVGVWVGNSNGSPMGFGVTGLTGAAPIWNGVMQAALNGQPAQPFQRPGDVRETAICNDFGTQNFAECKSPRNEIYYAPLPPVPADRVFLQANLDTFSGLIANANCPDFIEPRTFLRLTDERAIDWINNTDQGKAWAAIYSLQLPIEAPPSGECQPNQPRPSLRVSNPAANQTLSGIFVLNGTVANVPNFSRYQIEIGQGPDAQTFALVGNPYTTQVQGDGVIGSLDTNALPNGQYVLKLTVIDTAGRFAAVKIPILINNTQLDPNQQIQPTPIVIDGSGVPVNPTSVPIIIDNNPQPTPFIPTSEPLQPTPIIIDNNSGGGGLFAPTAIPINP